MMGRSQRNAAAEPPAENGKRRVKPKPLPKQRLCDSRAGMHILGNPSRTTWWRMERDGTITPIRLRPNGRKFYSVDELQRLAGVDLQDGGGS